MMRLLSFSCTACGTEGQRFSVLGCLERRPKTICSHCGSTIESGLSELSYVAFIFYANGLTLVLALPVIFSFVGGQWISATALTLLYLLLLTMPAIIIHARSVVVQGR
ncbi:hypothetical protein D3C71_1090260 [compost metagenome]